MQFLVDLFCDCVLQGVQVVKALVGIAENCKYHQQDGDAAPHVTNDERGDRQPTTLFPGSAD